MIDKQAIANYVTAHAEKTSQGLCARYCRLAFEAGGVDTTGHPGDAKDYGPLLVRDGAVPLAPATYTPQLADVVVFDGSAAHPHGHIAIFNGTQWVSDFVQHNMSPYIVPPPYHLYRFAAS